MKHCKNTVGLVKAKKRLQALMERVSRGAVITITHHGQPRAMIRPLTPREIATLTAAAQPTGREVAVIKPIPWPPEDCFVSAADLRTRRVDS